MSKTKAVLIFIGIMLVLYVGSRITTTDEKEAPDQSDEALAEIIDQPLVLDATITDANVLYAQIEDEGTNRNGYACSLCERLRKYNTKVLRVKLVKVSSHNDPKRDNAYGILLGECLCQK